VAHTRGAIVALGDDIVNDPQIVADAKRLATQLGAQLIGGAAAARVVQAGAVVERTTPLAPDLCVAIGNAQLDLAGATSFIKIGGPAGKNVDGAVTGDAGTGLAQLVKRLEER
jgi:hypothetical protein